ncbi:MAG: sulfite reductase subunit beta [Omnitrophica bacterium GWA2_52_8]|nr:MAG: sulfite reductase subunit beta [Omnitrophica bacterium GWA2_52_8]
MNEPSPKPSKVEMIKESSRFLRGTLADSLAQETTHFSADETQLLKHHGSYQQDNRDSRAKLQKEKQELEYSMMVRSKIPGGRMNAAQYLVHDDLATRFANGTLRITDRQGIQFHGVLKKNMKSVIRTINQNLGTTLGACGDVVRNVMACPAPFENRIRTEIYRFCKAVSDQFLPQGGAYQEIWLNGERMKDPAALPAGAIEPVYGEVYLPRKFKIGIAFPGDNCIDVYSHDIGIIPEVRQEGEGAEAELTGFNILVGGGMGMTHGLAYTYPRLASPFCFVAPGDLCAVTKAIVLVQRDFGNRANRNNARMKYLIDRRGLEWFRREVEIRFGKKTEPVRPFLPQTIETHHGWFLGADRRWFLGLFIENGRIKDEKGLRLKSGLRHIVEKYRCDVFLTPQQDILLSGFSESQKREIEDCLKSFGILLPEQLSNVLKDSMACPALPTCGLAITESERVMPSVMASLEKVIRKTGLENRRIMVRMTGCPNGCARPYNVDIGLVGRMPGAYTLFLGGSIRGDRLSFAVADKVKAEEVASTLEPLLAAFRKEAPAEESFGDYCARIGEARIKTCLFPAAGK